MNLKQRIVTTFAVAALTLGASSSVAFADSTSSEADTVLNVVCPVVATVDVTVTGEFEVDKSQNETSASLPGGFQVVLDLTCNWNPLFIVTAHIDDFQYTGGPVPTGQASSFPGGRLTLTNGTGSYVGVTSSFPKAGAPNVISTVFPGNNIDSGPVIVPSTTFIILPYAAPGVTTATWDGSLTNLPNNLATGEYVAPLTVTLSIA